MTYEKEYFKERMELEPKHEIEVKSWIAYFGLDKNDKILDFGSGGGQRVHWFRELGFEADGIEISDFAIANSHGKSRGHVRKEIGEEPYDFIYCVDVFEHLEEDELESILNDISKLTKKFLVGITYVNNKNFPKDSTHINGKTKDEWRYKLLKHFKRVYDAPYYFYENDMYLIGWGL